MPSALPVCGCSGKKERCLTVFLPNWDLYMFPSREAWKTSSDKLMPPRVKAAQLVFSSGCTGPWSSDEAPALGLGEKDIVMSCLGKVRG